uniref:LRRcap domain-containing protein n=1 Tax=Caenorhabditis japonica TaxID=281687 RepID=A0A8R1HMK3_CAEJA
MVKLTESAVYIRTKCSIENVKKLNLCVNDITSLAPLQECINLKELYLRKNCLKTLAELVHLQNLPNLRILWIDENPCVGEGGQEYRRRVVKMLPKLTKLDDKPVTPADHVDPVDDSVAEFDMIHSMCSSRSNRSNSMDLMSRSVYVGPAVVDRVMQPQILHFGDVSDDERVATFPPRSFSVDVPGLPMTDEHTTVYLDSAPVSQRSSRHNLMSQSMYGTFCGTLAEEPSSADGEDDWNDFSIDEDRAMTGMPLAASHRMYQSMHEGMVMEMKRPAYGRSVSMPRRRATSHTARTASMSPAREQRLTKIMSAVSVLLDELDPDGLRQVVDEAQRRLKKQR